MSACGDAAGALPRRVLVVCTANQCRSPMGEGLIRARLEAGGVSAHVVVESAGTWVSTAQPATANAVTAMAERGIDIADHRSRGITGAMLDAAHLVLVMTASHRQAVVAEHPRVAGKVRLISSLAGAGWDISDPIGGDLDDYRATAAELSRLIDAGWAQIVGAAGALRTPEPPHRRAQDL